MVARLLVAAGRHGLASRRPAEPAKRGAHFRPPGTAAAAELPDPGHGLLERGPAALIIGAFVILAWGWGIDIERRDRRADGDDRRRLYNAFRRQGRCIGRPLSITSHKRCGEPRRRLTLSAAATARSPICDRYPGASTYSFLHACAGCFRLERSPGGPSPAGKAPPCHGARGKPTDPNAIRLLIFSSPPASADRRSRVIGSISVEDNRDIGHARRSEVREGEDAFVSGSVSVRCVSVESAGSKESNKRLRSYRRR